MSPQQLLCFVGFLSLSTQVAAKFWRPGNYTDSSVNPCEDFYAYSCNPWFAYTKKPPFEPIWNPWIATSHKIKHRVAKILERHDHTLVQPRIFYRWCLRIVDNEDKYLEELRSLVEDLGGWPLIDPAWDKRGYDWFRQLATITSLLGIHPMVKVYVDLDYEDPRKVVIYVEPGNLIFPQYILTGSEHNAELTAYEKWILDTASHLSRTEAQHHSDAKEIVKFEMRLANIMNMKSRHERTTVDKAARKFPIDWRQNLERIFLGFTRITPNTTLVIRNYSALKNIFLLAEKIDKKVVANYLIWAAIKELSRDTTTHMRDLNFLIDQAILGVKDDLTREYECLDSVIKYFTPLLLPPYLKTYSSPRVFRKARAMFGAIRSRFSDNIMSSHWLSDTAKHLLTRKVQSIQLNLGYSPDVINGKSHYYRQLQMTSNHFTNILKLKKLQMIHDLEHSSRWPSSHFEVNAYYGVLQNSIFIPLGLLEPPFFHPDRPHSLNYGALGALMGHEMSHSLDPSGIRADPTGRIRKWLPERDLALYRERVQCYGNGEMMADNNGVKISLGALKQQGSAEEFFVGFAQMWCEMSEDEGIFAGGEHASNGDRVSALVNDKDFRESFNCSGGSFCDLW